MKKSELVSYIEKYHLGGIVEAVKWDISPTTGKATVGFVATANSTAGLISFPFANVGDRFGIASTSTLLKMLNAMGDELEIKSTIEHGINMILNLNDGVYEAKFSLADIHNLPQVPDILEPKGYDLEMPLTKEFRDQYIKAYRALGSIDRVTIEAMSKIKFTLGNKESYANKMTWEVDGDALPLKPIAFSGEAIAAILKVNDCNKATLWVSSDGLMKIRIADGESDVTYYIVELEDL